jgi:hypothetical protein
LEPPAFDHRASVCYRAEEVGNPERRHRAHEKILWFRGKVISTLHLNRHSLTAGSKSQYELHFKRWQLRKNLTRSEWEAIIRFMNARALRVEQIELVFQGTVLPEARVLREKARYCLAIESSEERGNGTFRGAAFTILSSP